MSSALRETKRSDVSIGTASEELLDCFGLVPSAFLPGFSWWCCQGVRSATAHAALVRFELLKTNF